MDTNQPLVDEMTTSVTNSERGNTFEVSDYHVIKTTHLDPFWFTFMSKRRVSTNAEKREAKVAANRYSRALRRVNFITVMKESHVYKEFVMAFSKTLSAVGRCCRVPSTCTDPCRLHWTVMSGRCNGVQVVGTD